MNQFFYNEKTHCLHIVGHCRESKCLPYNVRFFDSEKDALAYDGRSVRMCKMCQDEREKREREIVL